MWKRLCEHCNQEGEGRIEICCDVCGKFLGNSMPVGPMIPIELFPKYIRDKLSQPTLEEGKAWLDMKIDLSGWQLQYCLDCLLSLLKQVKEMASCADNATG